MRAQLVVGTGVWQKNARNVDITSVLLLYTVGRACRLSRGSRGEARATDPDVAVDRRKLPQHCCAAHRQPDSPASSARHRRVGQRPAELRRGTCRRCGGGVRRGTAGAGAVLAPPYPPPGPPGSLWTRAKRSLGLGEC